MAGEINRVVILQSGQISGTSPNLNEVAAQKQAYVEAYGVEPTAEELAAFSVVAQNTGLNAKDGVGKSSRAYVQTLSPEALADLHQISAMYGESVTSPTGALSPGLQARWADFISKQAVNGDVDVNALVMEVMRESYIENQKDLLFYAQKVKFYNELKKKIREELTHARQELAKHAGEPDEAALNPPYKAPTIYTEFVGEPKVVVKEWEGTKKAVGDAMLLSEDTTRTDNLGEVKTRIDPLYIDQGEEGFEFNEVSNGMVFNERKGEVRLDGNDKVHDGWHWENQLQDVTTSKFTEGSKTDGELVMDRNGDKKITADEVFGDETVTGRDVENGFEDLAALDTDKDGKLDSDDNDFGKVQVWTDKDGDGQASEGELKSLYDAGVLEVGTSYQETGDEIVAQAGQYTTTEGVVTNKKELESYIEELEEKLNTAGDDQQLANVDLQNMQQRQQQLLQAMSNVSKMLHDTAMAIIRKIGG